MKRKGLILNKSYDDLDIGASIIDYQNRVLRVDKHNNPYPWDCYRVIHDGFEIELWCEGIIVTSICCNQSCIYKGQELINMDFDSFVHLLDEAPINHDVIYVLTDKNHGQNQHVYDFAKSGLQVWVWRNRIRTVIIGNSNDEE